MIKRYIMLIIKMVVSMGLIIYAFGSTDIHAIWDAVRSADLFLLILAFVLIAVGFYISALRWQILLKAQHVFISIKELTKSYLVGTFFNNFMPTTIGGDIIRTYDVSKISRSAAQSFTVIIVERLTGVFALISYSFIGLSLGFSRFGNIPLVWFTGGIFLFILMAMIVIARKQYGKEIITENPTLFEKLTIKFNRMVQTLHIYKENKRSLVQALILAFLLQFNVILYFFIISYALQIRSPFYYFMIIIPLVHVILMFPVSINGIGVRENAFIFFLTQLGVSSASSIALSLLSFAMVLVYACIGGIVYAVRR